MTKHLKVNLVAKIFKGLQSEIFCSGVLQKLGLYVDDLGTMSKMMIWA
jgi:hypothetical protein